MLFKDSNNYENYTRDIVQKDIEVGGEEEIAFATVIRCAET